MQDLDMRKTCLVSVPRDFASSYSREMQDALANAIHSYPSLQRSSKRAKQMGLKGDILCKI
jgi:hypothetical protein